MTKRLSSEEKKKRKGVRKQQKAKSPTVKTVSQPKPEDPKPAETPSPVNLCDDCAYEFGECEGVPKFGEGEGADNVVACPAFVNVASMPTADISTVPGPAEPTTPWNEALKRLDEFGQSILLSRADEIRAELDLRFGPSAEPTPQEIADTIVKIVNQIAKEEGGPSDGLQDQEAEAEDLAAMEARRRKTQRFFQEEDLGTCQTCGQPLKRTALNRDRDAVRCVNGRCRQYRFVINTLPAGV